MINIVTVNWDAYDFLGLLIESLAIFSQIPYELIVIDNSINRKRIEAPHVYQCFMTANIGHGKGLNYGVGKAREMFPQNPFLMFLDSDCHIIKHRWEYLLMEKMKNYDILAGRGVPAKPVRPACMFMRRELGVYDWSETEGYKGNRVTPNGYDVACRAYYKIMADNFRIGFLEPKKNSYGTLNGEEFCVDDIPICYHHWHGSHLKERQIDFPNNDLMEDKKKLFGLIPWHLP